MKPTIFTYINGVLYENTKDIPVDKDPDSSYSSYMLCRWMSMYSPEIATLLNDTANWLYPIFTTKNDSYTFLHNIIPCQSFRRINYIKKSKQDHDNSHDEIIQSIAESLEISKREVNVYVGQLNMNLSKYKDCYDKKS